MGSDGSTSARGTSAGLSTSADRSVFLEARRAFDAILIGGRTAASESYARTPAPVVVVSGTRPSVIDINPRALWWNCSPSEALERAVEKFGPNICVEGGVNFLNHLLSRGKIDELRLSLTPFTGGDNQIAIEDLLSHFKTVSTSQIDETKFYTCSDPALGDAIRNQK